MRPPQKIIISMTEKTRVRNLSAIEYELIARFGAKLFIKKTKIIRITSICEKIKKSTTRITLKYSVLRLSVADNDLTQRFRSLLIDCTATCKRIWDKKNYSVPYTWAYQRAIITVSYIYEDIE